MFIDPGARIPVSDGQGNTIYIRAKMDVATEGQFKDALVRITGGRKAVKSFQVGRAQTALLQLNIVAWEGPRFAGVPCNHTMIGRLDPHEPLVVQVLEEIDRRNAPPALPEAPGDPDQGNAPAASSGDGGTPLTEDAKASPAAIMTYT
jgi:hypothetical protein